MAARTRSVPCTRQRGMAVIVALLVVALVAVIATALLTRLLPDGLRLSTPDGEVTADRGVVSGGTADSPFTEELVKAVAAHRFRDRPAPRA